MKKRRQIGLLLVLGLVISVVAFIVLSTREPAYQGKRLSQWLEEFNRVNPGEINQEAESAMLQIGTNALPFLVRNLCSLDPHYKLTLMQWYNKWSPKKILFKPLADRQGPTLMAFYVLGKAGKLGPAAEPYITALGDKLNSRYGPDAAAFALLQIGAKSMPCLSDALENSNPLVRQWAAIALAKLNLEFEKRGFSFGLTLSDFSGQPIFRPVFGFSEDDVPAFVNNLKSTNAFVRAATAEAVGEIHITAWNGRIVPVLLRLLEDNDIPVRNAAAQALKRIDPEAVAKVGVK